MFNPDSKAYPRNAAGEPEFATIVIHCDGSVAQPNEIVVQKMVLSSEDLIASLTACTTHFAEPGFFSNPDNARLLVEAGRQPNPVFVYVTPREGTTLILLGTPTWDSLVQHPDFGRSSSLLASEKLQETIAQVQQGLYEKQTSFSKLLLLDLSPEKFEQSGSSEGGPGKDAESLRDTADFEEQ